MSMPTFINILKKYFNIFDKEILFKYNNYREKLVFFIWQFGGHFMIIWEEKNSCIDYISSGIKEKTAVFFQISL